jgi:hypothetical protein
MVGTGGAFKPMIRLVTLLTVDAAGCDSGTGATSSVGEARPIVAAMDEALALPKLSFQRDGFFVGTRIGDDGGEDAVADEPELSTGDGIAYAGVGSKDGCL